MGKIPTERWHGLWWRVPLCGAIAAAALKLGSNPGTINGIVVYTGALASIACTMADPLSGWTANYSFGWLGRLFYPERTFKRVPPIYGPAESRRMEGRPAEALEAYEAILAEYPDDGRCYLAMMDIAWQDMEDAGLAHNFYRRARQAVSDEEYLAEMRQAYDDFAPSLKDRLEASPAHYP